MSTQKNLCSSKTQTPAVCRAQYPPTPRLEPRNAESQTWRLSSGLLILALYLSSVMLAAPASAHAAYWSTSGIRDSASLKSTLLDLRDRHEDIDELAVTWDGEWIVVADSEIHHSRQFPSSPLAKVREYCAAGLEIDAVAFTPSGHWAVVAEDHLWRSNALPEVGLLTRKIQERQSAGKRITELAFTSDNRGWSIVSGSWAYSKNVPGDFYEAILERHKSQRTVKNISFGRGGAWVLVADQWFASSDLSEAMAGRLRSWLRGELEIDHAVLGPQASFLLYGEKYRPDLRDRIQYIENSLGPDDKNIYQRMQELNIPGVSLAVVDGDDVVYARTYGNLKSGTQSWVRSSSPFAAGSISKLIASAGMMSHIEGSPVNLSYQLANFHGDVEDWIHLGRLHPEIFGTSDNLPLDIRIWQLLSHTANMNNNSIEIDPEYLQGSLTTLGTLLGYFCDRAGCGFGRGKHAWYDSSIGTGRHGETFSYSNKGFLVAQAILETSSGQNFEDLIEENLLAPLGMKDSAFSMDLPSDLSQRAASWHNKDGRPIPRHFIPNSAAGGLYTTPTDYAQFVIMLLNDGRSANGARIISPDSVDSILTNRAPGYPDEFQYGFGVELLSSRTFAHGGAVKGGSSCFEGDRDFGEAIVMMTNAPFSKIGGRLMQEIRQAFREAYRWPRQNRNYHRSC